MLPKETVPEGSRKVINGKEVYTLHYFTMGEKNCFETVSGDFIFPNGELVKDRTVLESLPEQHKQRALAWWEKNFGDGGTVEEDTAQPSVADLMAENKALREQIALMEADPPGRQEFFEPEKGTQVAKDAKGRFQAKSKVDRGTDVLKQMGIGT
jgi:hypothetical protein